MVADLVFGESSLPSLQMASFLLCLHMAQMDIFLVSLLIRVLILFMKSPLSQPSYLSKAPPPNTIILGGRTLICEFGVWGHKHSVCNKYTDALGGNTCAREWKVSLMESVWPHCMFLGAEVWDMPIYS